MWNWPRFKLGNLLPIKEAVLSDHGIATIIRKERRLDKSAIANSADQLPQKLQSLIADLIIRHGLRIQVVVVCGKATTQMPRLQQLREVRIVPMEAIS